MLPIKSCKKPGQVHINTPRVLSKIHQKTAFLHNISISLHKYVNDAVQKALFIEQNNSQRPYRPKIAGILFVSNDPAQFACLQHQQGQYIAAQRCQGRLRHSVGRM